MIGVIKLNQSDHPIGVGGSTEKAGRDCTQDCPSCRASEQELDSHTCALVSGDLLFAPGCVIIIVSDSSGTFIWFITTTTTFFF